MTSYPPTHTPPLPPTPAPLPSPPTTLYFAYGSNLSLTQMSHRCPSSPHNGVAALHHHRWIINARGYANVVPSPGDVVYGLTYALTAEDEARLDVDEGVPWAYEKRMMDLEVWAAAEGRAVVEGERGEVRRGLVYVDERRVVEGTPRREYVGRMNRGVEEAVGRGVPRWYVEGWVRRFVPGVRGVGEEGGLRVVNDWAQ